MPPATKKPYPLTKYGALRALRALGDDRAAVARALRKGGHSGSICLDTCPVARYLQTLGFVDAGVAFTKAHIRVVEPEGPSWEGFPIPKAVQDFVHGFDRGQLARDLWEPSVGKEVPPWERH